MRISVVIGTRNRAPLLRVTLEHLRRQQYAPGDEVIVVDNASTDDTPSVVTAAAAGFPVPLLYLTEHRPGKSSAVNRGVRSAHGEVLALTDDDVQVADDWIARIREAFSDPTLDLIGGRVDPWWEEPPPRWLRWDRPESSAMRSPLALLHYGAAQPLGDRTAVGANLVVRRATFTRMGGFDPDLGRQGRTLLCGEDHDLCMRLVQAGCRCEYRPDVRVRHWVPSERLRLRYFARWFFWSGITNAVLDMRSTAGAHGSGGLATRHMVVRFGREALRTVASAVRGRFVDAVESTMECAFALGYVWEALRPTREPARVATSGTAADAPNARVA